MQGESQGWAGAPTIGDGMIFAWIGVGILIGLLFVAVVYLDKRGNRQTCQTQSEIVDIRKWLWGQYAFNGRVQGKLNELDEKQDATNMRMSAMEGARLRDIYAANLASGKFKRVAPATRKRARRK